MASIELVSNASLAVNKEIDKVSINKHKKSILDPLMCALLDGASILSYVYCDNCVLTVIYSLVLTTQWCIG